MARFTKDHYKTRQVLAYIGELPSTITLVRKIRTPTPGGTGYRETDAPLAPQNVRLDAVPSSRQATRQSPAGQVLRVDTQIIGPPDLDVQTGDTFDHEGGSYQVIHVEVARQVRTVADAQYLGVVGTP